MTNTGRTTLLLIGAAVVIALVGWAMMRQARMSPPAISTRTATTDTAPRTVTQEPELVTVPRTRLDVAKQEIDKGAVLVIDVRDADSYIASHIPGAVQIPLARVEGEISYLPKDKPILTYCT
jgi:rhodanese-like protein